MVAHISRWAVVGVTAAVALTLSACSSCSMEAYCEVVSERVDEFVTSMEGLDSQDPLAGLSTVFSSSGDLVQMWEDAADAAPSEIQDQVEMVRDTWNGDLFADADDGNWLDALGAGFAAADDSVRAHEAVFAYTDQNCDAVSQRLGAAAAEPASSGADSSDSLPAATQAAPAQPSPADEPGEEPTEEPEAKELEEADLSVLYWDRSDWDVFGPYLIQRGYLGEDARFFDTVEVILAGGSPVEIDAEELLPEEEVLGHRFTYGMDDSGEPFVIGVVRIRTPASGLSPEGEHYEAITIDTSGPRADLRSRVELPEDIPGFGGLGTSGGHHIVLSGSSEEEEPAETFGIDVESGEVVWTEPGGTEHLFGEYAHVYSPGERWNQNYRCEGVNAAREIATGEAVATVELIDDDFSCRGHLGDRFWWFSDTETVDDDESGRSESHNTHRLYDLESGGSIDFVTIGEAATDLRKDPVQPLIRTDYATDTWDGAQDLVVADITTGETVYSLDAEQSEALEVSVVSFNNGLLYLSTTDEHLVVDVHAGEEIGTWEVYPERIWETTQGTYTWMDDGSLHLDWEYDPENLLSTYDGDEVQ